jgi:alpha-glucosidase (family GH31 glycosyl hydrolase)
VVEERAPARRLRRLGEGAPDVDAGVVVRAADARAAVRLDVDDGAATLSAAASGFSNWSHDVGGYLGHRLVERCPAELLVRWVQLGCFTPLMQAHGRLVQEPWTYDDRTLRIYRSYVLLHEQLVPYVRAAAATATRCGLPIIRPLHLVDPFDDRGWSLADAFGYGPSLWVAPVLDEGARTREVALPRGDWIETWSGAHVRGGGEVVAPAPRDTIPVWCAAARSW